jgi:hypothetical protein
MNKKTFLTCALVAAGIISQASADNVVYLTGSTAFRTAAFNTLDSAAGPAAGGVFDIPGTTVGGHVAPAITLAAFGASHANGDNGGYMLFHGNIGGTATYIDCAWSGSEAGIANIASFPAPNVVDSGTGAPLQGVNEEYLLTTVAAGINTGNPTTAQLDANPRQGDFSLADTSQASSDALTQNAPLKSYGQVAAVTFTWVKNNNSASAASACKTAWSRISNVSLPQLVNQLVVPQTADVFSGNAADVAFTVYTVGRNNGSGTRANMENDTTFGLTSPVNQYAIGQAPDGGLAGNNPNGTLNLFSIGNDGYEGGGSVATALGTAGSTAQADPFTGAAGWIGIGYLGVSDAVSHNLTTANWLTENGVLESSGAVAQGSYSYWGYENEYGRPGIGGFQDADATVFYNSLVFNITAGYVGGAANDIGVPIAAMNCTKPTDGSFPAHN